MDNLFKANEIEVRKQGKKGGIKAKTDKTIKSLQEVEHFLCQTKRALKHIKLYNILKH